MTFLSPEISQVGLTKIAINFSNLNQSASKMSQIEANTCGFEFSLTSGAKIRFSIFLPPGMKKIKSFIARETLCACMLPCIHANLEMMAGQFYPYLWNWTISA